MELRLGVKLYDRGPKGLALTEEGSRIFVVVNSLLAFVDNFTVQTNEINNRLVGRLSITVFKMTLTNPKVQVATALRAFNDIAPDVDLQVRILGTDASERRYPKWQNSRRHRSDSSQVKQLGVFSTLR